MILLGVGAAGCVFAALMLWLTADHDPNGGNW